MKFNSFKKAALTIGLLTSPFVASASDYSLTNVLSSAIKSTDLSKNNEEARQLERVVNQVNDVNQTNINYPVAQSNEIKDIDDFNELLGMFNSNTEDNRAKFDDLIKNLQGPNFRNQQLIFSGEVIAIGAPFENKPCVQLRVLKDMIYSGGRVWICDTLVTNLNLLDRVDISGRVTSSRLTRIGPHRRVIPIVTSPNVNKLRE